MNKTQVTLSVFILASSLAACGSAQVDATVPTAEVEVAAGGTLVVGGAAANFGVVDLAPGFTPDPHQVSVVSGGAIDAATLGLGAGCNGWLTQQPDIIVRLSGPSQMLRFYVTSNGGEDTTLVINAGDGAYHCNDDSHGGTNPTVDINNAPAGQYDVWVGSYQQGVQATAVLNITELAGNHP